MTTDSIIKQLDDLGVSIASKGEQLSLKPGSRVPKHLLDEIRLHKSDLLDQLTDDSEVVEIVRQVREQGYVLLWSNTLQDLVAFAQTDADRDNVPPEFTTYTITELMEVFGDATPSPGSLKLILEAKKHGGRIIDEG